MLALLDIVFFRFPGVLIVAVLTLLILSRKRARHRLQWVIGSYLVVVVAALAFALIARDEFGYGFIPLIVMTAPWQLLRVSLPTSALTGEIAFGLLLNCALFCVIDRLAYPRHVAGLTGRHAT